RGPKNLAVRLSAPARSYGDVAQVSRHGARTWVRVLWFSFGLSAVMPWKVHSLLEARQRFIRAASPWPPFGCSTLPPIQDQSEDWFQMVGAFSRRRWLWSAQPFATSEALASPDGHSVAARDRSDAPASSLLGGQEDSSCS